MAEHPSQAIRTLLEQNGARMLACTFVDNAGVSRVKAVPIERLESAARSGIGISYVFAVFGVDDHITTSPGYDTPSGDMRLIPDLDRAVVLAASPGWAWAPAMQFDQELRPMPICQRRFLEQTTQAAAEKGITFSMAYEVEFTLLDLEGGPVNADLPSYSPRKLLPAEAFMTALVEALGAQGIRVVQVHPEYAAGQYELSVSPRPPVEAADQHVLLRNTICRIALQHGYRVSFAPVVLPGEVGNGCHLHFSAWRGGKNLFTRGSGPHELTGEGEALAAGVLHRLPEMPALLATSVPSYQRLKPHNWAGAYACWGHENREAALRLCKGTITHRAEAANFELKSIDGTSNPYLVAGVVIAAALDGLSAGRTLPEPVQVDPGGLSEEERAARGIVRLASSLGEAVEKLARSEFLKDALGLPLYESFLATRRFDWERYGEADQETLLQVHRWRYG